MKKIPNAIKININVFLSGFEVLLLSSFMEKV